MPAHVQSSKSSLYWFLAVTLPLIFICSCKKNEYSQKQPSQADSLRIVQEILTYRAQLDSFLRYHPDSPFQRDSSVKYLGLRWFPPDMKYNAQSKLYRYASPETIVVAGTYAEEGRPFVSGSVGRKHLKYGYFLFNIDGNELRLNVYKSIAFNQRSTVSNNRLKLWFTDQTTGKETYGPGANHR